MTTTPCPPPNQSGPVAALLITKDPALRQQIDDLAAHHHITITTITRPPRTGPLWSTAPLVLLGADLLARCHAAGLPPRSCVIVVADHLSTDIDALRRAGEAVGSRHLAVLPGAWAWLAGELTHPATTTPGGANPAPAPVT